MDTAELKRILQNAGIPESLYNFDGNGKGDDGRISMMKFGGNWRIYLLENGRKVVDEYFDTEAEACDFFLKKLMD